MNAIHILPNISRITGDKFGQLIKYNVGDIVLQNHTENEAGKPVSDLVLFFKKALCEVKASGQHLRFNTFL